MSNVLSSTNDRVKTAPGQKYSRVIESGRSSQRRDNWRGGHRTQILLTIISGVPKTGQKPWRASPEMHLSLTILAITVGYSIGLVGVRQQMLWPLIPSYILIVHGFRKMALVILHECAHNAFFWGNTNLNNLVGDLTAVMLIGENFKSYIKSHRLHHGAQHMTAKDPSVHLQQNIMGLKPGRSEARLWVCFVLCLVSPLIHFRLMFARLESSANNATLRHILFSIVYLTVLVALIVHLGTSFVVLWILPLTFLYNVSVMVRACSEHVYPPTGTPKKHMHALSTHAVFLGPNENTRPIWKPFHWAIAVVNKLAFFPGEANLHDQHHRHAKNQDWYHWVFERQRMVSDWHDQDEANPGSAGPPFTEVWGLAGILIENVRSLSLASPNRFKEEKQ